MNENEIRDLLGAEIGEEPPISGGPAAVFAGARVRVVRTRAVASALSMAAVLGVAGGAVALGGAGGRTAAGSTSPASSPAVAATTLASTAPSATARPAQCPTQATTANPALSAEAKAAHASGGQVPLDPRSLTELLKTALPCGTPTAYHGEDDSSGNGLEVSGTVDVTDQAGVGAVTVRVAQHAEFPHDKSFFDCAKVGVADHATTCVSTVTADGTAVLLEEAPDKEQGVITRSAQVLFPDDHTVMISERNTDTKFYQAKVTATRAVPPLTLDQLRGLALDTPWPLSVSREFAEHAKQDLAGYVDSLSVTPPAGWTASWGTEIPPKK
ncbi:hypothetical protein [Catenulispora subtropica]|uniref:Uncharacterized protein n=1 Tax=Catenulispora subtropica TaxID=450798 RepID=A0ABP5C1B9_9ACTN